MLFKYGLAIASIALTSSISSSAMSLSNLPDTSAVAVTSRATKVKAVEFTLKNKSGAPMTIFINQSAMTLAVGEEIKVALAEGTDVFAADKTTLKIRVTSDLSESVVSLR